MTTRMIPIARIDAGDRLRVLDPAWVALLAEEIATDGLDQPIRIVERGDAFRLVSGARRLAAHISLGRDTIEARIATAAELADESAVRLAEIKADMLRGDLTALDRAVYIAAWCDIHRAASGPAKPGPKKAVEAANEDGDELSANLALNWSEAAQSALQIGRRTVFRSLKIAGIEPDIRRAIALHSVATRQSELLLLAEQTPSRQADIVAKLLVEPVEANSVTDAIDILDRTVRPAIITAFDKFSQRFTALKPVEKKKFFDQHADEIEAWFAERLAAPKKHLKVVA